MIDDDTLALYERDAASVIGNPEKYTGLVWDAAKALTATCSEIRRLRLSSQSKPLDWTPPSDATNWCWTAKTILGTYTAAFEDGWYACLEDGGKWEWEPDQDPRSYSGPEAAKQACQDHFERTIRSALQTV